MDSENCPRSQRFVASAWKLCPQLQIQTFVLVLTSMYVMPELTGRTVCHCCSDVHLNVILHWPSDSCICDYCNVFKV